MNGAPAAGEAHPDLDDPFERIVGVFTAPTMTFASIARRPDWVVPLIVLLLFAGVTGFVTSSQVDFERTMRDQLEGRKMTEEQIEKAIEMGSGMQKIGPWIGVLFAPVILLIVAALIMLGHKIMGGAGGFAGYFSVALYGWFPQLVKSLIVTVMLLAGEPMTVNEMMVAAYSNLGFLVDSSTEPVLFALLTKLDIFTLWSIFLMTIGSAFVSRGARLQSAVIVTGLWCVYVGLSLVGPLIQTMS